MDNVPATIQPGVKRPRKPQRRAGMEARPYNAWGTFLQPLEQASNVAANRYEQAGVERKPLHH